MNPFLLAPEAAQDLDDIWEYMAQDDLEAADRFIQRLHKNILNLAETPGAGHRREDLVEDARSSSGQSDTI